MSCTTTVLFDLDGTLLPMDQERFTKHYFALLAQKLAAHGYEQERLIRSVWEGSAAMVRNTGEQTNEAVFWAVLRGIYGERIMEDLPVFEQYYHEEFEQVRQSCGFQPLSAEVVRLARQKGCRVVLATNPIFPAVATEARIRWAGLEPEDFDDITTYENSRHCKPNPAYYLEVTARMQVRAENCLMVGNDVTEDMVAERLGMRTFLVTDCLINRENRDIQTYPNGDFSKLKEWMEQVL